jgi:hypothetical protein
MQVLVCKIDDVRKHPDAESLTIVRIGEHEVVANLHDDGTPRWVAGDVVVYVPEGAIIPEDVLKECGYWEEGAKKGMLGGSKGNSVTMRRFAGFESRGLIFKVELSGIPFVGDYALQRKFNNSTRTLHLGDDVAEFLGIKEYIPA